MLHTVDIVKEKGRFLLLPANQFDTKSNNSPGPLGPGLAREIAIFQAFRSFLHWRIF
jgi:hypothetical protein